MNGLGLEEKKPRREFSLCHSISSARWLLLILILSAIAVPSLASAASCGNVPSSLSSYIVACYPANIVNNQASPTPSGFQQIFNNTPFNALAGNVVVYNGISGSLISAWAENYNTIWINLGANTIPATSSANGVYYFGVGSSSTSFFDTGFANDIGEAPQYSPSYAEYDNGANIFLFYYNFAGTTLLPLTLQDSGSATVNNQLTFTITGGGNNAGTIVTPTTYNSPAIADILVKSGIGFIGNTQSGFGTTFGQHAVAGSEAGYAGGVLSTSATPFTYGVTWYGGATTGSVATSNTGVFGFSWVATGTEKVYQNYSLVYTATDSSFSQSTEPVGIWMRNGNGVTAQIVVQWFRDRQYPPDGIMPSPSVGTLTPYVAPTCGTVPSSVSSYIVGCYPITITNLQVSATPSGFQQMLNNTPFNALAGNVVVYNGISGQLVSAWVENKSIIWVNLGANTIPAGTSVSGVYRFGIANSSTNFFSASGANDIGEAPQLSPSYAEYDNGKSVFTSYYNFTSSSPWTAFNGGGGTFGDGLTLAGGGSWNGYHASVTLVNSSDWLETDMEVISGEPNFLEFGTCDGMVDGVIASYSFGFAGGGQTSCSSGGAAGYGWILEYTPDTLVNTPYLVGIQTINGGNTYFTDNYTQVGASEPSNLQTGELMVEAHSETGIYYWLRERTQPPSDVMPALTYGGFIPVSPPPHMPTLIISPNPSNYGQSITINAICPSGGSCAIDYPTLGTHIATGSSGTASFTYTAGALGAGTYSNYYANDIAGATNTIGNTITITQATPMISLPSFPSPNAIIYNGNPQTFTGNVICLFNQCTANLLVNNVATNSFNIQATNTINGAAGTYVVIANTIGNGNYIAATATNTLIISQAPTQLSWNAQCISSIPMPCTTTANVFTIGNQVTASLYLNNVFLGSTNTLISNTVNGANVYTYTFNTLGNNNYTSNSISYSFTQSYVTFIYLRNSTRNPAISFPTLGGIPSCTPNTLGGTCIGTDVISGNQALQNNLFVIGNVLQNSGTLMMDGFVIIATQTFNNINGIILAGKLSNGGAAGGTGSAVGGSVLNSYAGSGGGGGGYSGGNGGAGGATMVAGGTAGTPSVNGGAGTTPSSPAVSNANIVSWFNNGIQNYLGGAGGGQGYGGGAFGGGGSYGIYIQANNIYEGTLIANGIAGQGLGGSDAGGGGGGGIIIVAYQNTLVMGTTLAHGGSGGSGSTSNGGNGGMGRSIAYNYITPPLASPTTQQYYPYQFTNSTGAGTILTFTVNSIYNGIITTLANNVPVINIVPLANQSSGLYTYNISILNSVSDTTQHILINVSANMTDIKTPLTFNSPIIQYFPNLAILPTSSFTAIPSSWQIWSAPLSASRANTVQGDQFQSNATSMPLQLKLVYPFTSFNVSLPNNPALQNPIALTPFSVYSSNTGTANILTRKIANISTYSQATLTQLLANTSMSVAAFFNNYSFSQSITPFNSTNFQVYMPQSNYQNPSITISNITLISKATNYFQAVNNYCPSTITNGNYVTYKPYLVDSAGQLYTFQTYIGGGTVPTNYYMLVQEASGSGTVQVESYKITAVPFALPLETSTLYSFAFYNPPCSGIVYQSPLSVWTSPITFTVPNNVIIPVVQTISANAVCVENYNGIASLYYVTCNGADPTNFVTSWTINLYNVTSILDFKQLVNQTNISGSSFTWTHVLPNNDILYNVQVIAHDAGGSNMYSLQILSWLSNLFAQSATPYTVLNSVLAIFLFFTVVMLGGSHKSLMVIFSLVAIFLLNIFNIFPIDVPAFFGLVVAGIIMLFIFQSDRTG